MAACRRLLHGLRNTHLQLLLTTTKATAISTGLGFTGLETEVGLPSSSHSSTSSSSHSWSSASSTSSASSAWCWQQERCRCREEYMGWSSWRHLVRGLHGTAWRFDGEDDEEKRGTSSGSGSSGSSGGGVKEVCRVGNEEARNLVQQVHLAALKKRLRGDPRDTIVYEELLGICRTVGMASDDEEAHRMARVLNEAGVVLTFRDKVHLHPEKIAELVANVLPLSLLGEDDQRRLELLAMTKKKDEIDSKAHKQMRAVLWTGLCGLTLQVLLFFRLTFWELSWDVMEPIAFFATASGIICGYTYFMFTSRDPSYQDFMQRIYQSRQRKLIRKQNFDIKRYKELQMQCESGWKPLTKKILEDAD